MPKKINETFSKYISELMDLSDIMALEWDMVADEVTMNNELTNFLGYDDNVISGYENYIKLIYPEDRNIIANMRKQSNVKGAPTVDLEYRMVKKDGQPVWMNAKSIIVAEDTDKHPAKVVTTFKENRNDVINAMFNASPYPSMMFDSSLRVVDCNEQLTKLLEFRNKDEVINNFPLIISTIIPEEQSDGKKSIPFAERVRTVISKGGLDFDTELIINGRRMYFRVHFKKVIFDNDFALVLYLDDRSKEVDSKNRMFKQDKILKVSSEVAYKLVDSSVEDFEIKIWEVLKTIGETIDANRMYIWENYEENGELYTKQIYEWYEGSVPQQGKACAISSHYQTEIYHWLDSFEQNKSINSFVKDIPSPEREVLESQGIFSILVIPIFVLGKLWGFVGFDDCKNYKVYEDFEETILRSIGGLLVNSILKNRSTVDLIKARESALESNNAKTEFLSRMSHEIRTPMNAIIGMNTIALNTTDRQRITYCLNKIDAASKQMMNIINDILDMSKIEANKLEIIESPFDFENMIYNVSNLVQVKVDEKDQNFKVNFNKKIDSLIISDELRITQVLTNLLSNATKFTPQKGSVTLNIMFYNDNKNDRLKVEVKDTGIGITDEQKNKLFRSFEQADGSITRRYGGTGLGLALCKRIINLMEGDIWVESVYKKGSSFVFDIPVEYGVKLENKRENVIISENLRIMVVDENKDSADYLHDLLQTYKIKIDVVNSGVDATRLVTEGVLRGEYYDIVFIDWKMSFLSGYATAKRIKDLTRDRTEIVIMSVVDMIDIKNEIAELRVDKYLQKPILPNRVHEILIDYQIKKDLPSNKKEDIKWDQKHILVVEDIEINQEIVIAILADTGINIDTALNGRIALDMIKKDIDKYDLILMDMQMPEMDGLEATRAIRNCDNKKAKEIPIIAMTANAFKEDIEACIKAGMNDHVAKPIDVAVLKEKLETYLS